MAELKSLDETSPSVQAHLGILHGVIERMAGNSAAAKTWCITLVSAILVVVADSSQPGYAFLALGPTSLFLILDVYYLSMEKGFRNSYEEFVKKLHDKTLTAGHLYSVKPEGVSFGLHLESFFSIATFPFYLTIAAMIAAAWWFVLS